MVELEKVTVDDFRSARAPMDCLAFSLAGFRGCLDPYVSVFLLTQGGWTQDRIGLALTISGIIGITLHVPLGAFIDATRAKRGLIITGAVALAVSTVGIGLVQTFAVVLTAYTVMAIMGGVFGPAMAAIALGIVGWRLLAWRLGRNAAFDRAGYLFSSIVAGTVGYVFEQRAVLWVTSLFAAMAASSVLAIPVRAIDRKRSRGLDANDLASGRPVRWSSLLQHRQLITTAVVSALFHFANAPMLMMLGQKLALANPGLETMLTTIAIVTAQLTAIPAALLIGARAEQWGRKPFLLCALCALPLRAVLLTVSDHPALLLATQILDGLGVGVFDAILPLILADIMRGTGRYNAGQGFVGMVQGVFGSLSFTVAGTIIVSSGYNVAFLSLGVIATASMLIACVAVPETRKRLNSAI